MTQRPRQNPRDIDLDRDVDKHVGRLIRQRRQAVGMSQTELAQRLGVSFQQVQKYERGANRVAASTLWRLATAFCCEASDMFDGLERSAAVAEMGERGAWNVAPAMTAADAGKVLMEAYLALTPVHQRALLAVARTLASEQVNPR